MRVCEYLVRVAQVHLQDGPVEQAAPVTGCGMSQARLSVYQYISMQMNVHQAMLELPHLRCMVEEFKTYPGDGLCIDCNSGLASVSK